MSMQPYNNIGTPLGGPVDDMMDDEDIDGLPEIDDGADFEEEEAEVEEIDFQANLAEVLDEAVMKKIALDLVDLIENDDSSREEWKKVYEEGMVLLGLTFEERSEPFEGASGVTHPILNEAVTQFQAQSYKELLPPGGPARAAIIGKVTPEREAQAERVKAYMNYQITQVMEEYDPDFDQMLFYVGYGGSAFKKVYYDTSLERATSPYVLPKDLIVPYLARDLMTAERVTHVLRMSKNELRKQQVSGFYRDVDLGEPAENERDQIQERLDDISGREPTGDSEEYVLYECHCNLDIEGFEDADEDGEQTGIKLPYIVTFDPDSMEILSIRRNYREDDSKKKKRQYFVHYKFLPGLGFYGFGLVHLLGNLSRSSTSILRQLIDAGTLANLPGGFKTRGLRMEDQSPIQPGEWRDVDAPGGVLRESLMPLPYGEPSATLMQLLGFCIDAAQKFVGTTDLGMGDSNQEMPVGTTIALLERGSRVISAVHKRLHNAQMQELKLLAQVFADSLPPEYPYEVIGGEQTIMAADFDGRVDVVPVSDPNIFSMTQRISLAQQQLQLAQAAPQMHNLYEAYRRMYSALGVQDIDLVLPPPPPPQPEDALLENARSLVIPTGGNPLKAFPDQDHIEHIKTHVAFIQMPIMQTSPAVYGVLLSHILEHASLAAQQMVVLKMQQQMGASMPNLDPVQMATAIAKEEAQLMGQLMQQLVPPPPQGVDPLIEIQQQNLQLKARELEQKGQEGQARLQFDQQKLAKKDALDRERLQSMEDVAQLRANVSLERARQ